jgi:hypothetical protein
MIAIVLLLSSPLYFIIQIILNWICKFINISISPFVGCFVSILLGSTAIVGYVLVLLSGNYMHNPLEVISCLIFTLFTLVGFAYMYFATFAISEVSLHMHIMLMILISKELSIEEIKQSYNKTYMLEERLTRLIEIGQICKRDNLYYVNSKLLLYGSRIFDFWKKLLGLPIKLNNIK